MASGVLASIGFQKTSTLIRKRLRLSRYYPTELVINPANLSFVTILFKYLLLEGFLLLVPPQFDLRPLWSCPNTEVPFDSELFKASKHCMRCCNLRVIYGFVLLKDSCLTGTKANLLFVQVFIPLSHRPWHWSQVNWLKCQSFYRNW